MEYKLGSIGVTQKSAEGSGIEEMKAPVVSGKREISVHNKVSVVPAEVMVGWNVLEDTVNIQDSVEIGQTTVRVC